ncbi:MAG: hypothetical protein FJW86_12980 [Actinobacteria bacterium]|nr:hypothetical protein [Actinomycetota bacterium]
MEALADALKIIGFESVLLPIDGEPTAPADVAVVDSYIYRADDTKRFRAETIAAVDDLSRNLAVAIVVDPAPGATVKFHAAAHHALTGPEYALVDPKLVDIQRAPVEGAVTRILVTTGGTDVDGYGYAIAHDLTKLLPSATISLVMGPWSSDQVPRQVNPIRTSSGLGNELAISDLVVTAGGVTMLESLALGRPTVAVLTAENQQRYVEGAAAVNAVVPASIDDAALAAVTLAGNADLRVELAHRAANLIDGRGALRVARALT